VVEFDLNGNLTGGRKLDPLDEFPGVALTSDHPYVHRHDRETKVARVFRLNRAMLMWEPVDETGTQLVARRSEFASMGGFSFERRNISI
jgi:hypothetical protein